MKGTINIFSNVLKELRIKLGLNQEGLKKAVKIIEALQDNQ